MNNLAETYSALGRHDDALAMQERVTEFRRRTQIISRIPAFVESEDYVWHGIACF
jgi:hypothetical protein